MRLALLSLFLAAGALYTSAAWHSYREERSAREAGTSPPPEGFTHPEANLRILRESFENNDYSDRLFAPLAGSLQQAPSFYQPPFLMASFYANRLERPDLARKSFEAAIARFPSNGRLHLTYTEWLLTPRATAPYRAFRSEAGSDSRDVALEHLESATALEPDLARQALSIMLRFRVPVAEWADRLPRSESTNALILDTVDQAPEARDVRAGLLREFLAAASTVELCRRITLYAEKWGEAELALDAASKWREAAITAAEGPEIVRATAAIARHHLGSGDSDRAYKLLRETLTLIEARSLASENSLELLCLIGDEYRRRRQHAMAQGLYSEALAMSSYYAPAYLALARNYRELGDLENARRELEELLRFDPSNDAATRYLEELDKLAARRR